MRHLFPHLLLALLALGGAARAQDGMVKLETADDSRGWDAVGKLILGKKGFCTGALIGPQLVLTAAHCLYDKTTGVQLRPEEIEFQAGFRNGRAVAYRRVSRAVVNATFDPVAKPGVLRDYFRGNPNGDNPIELLKARDRISPAYRDRDVRLDQLDDLIEKLR